MSAVGDARKRLEAQHQAHPDPAVRELLARAWDEGWRKGQQYSNDVAVRRLLNPYRGAR